MTRLEDRIERLRLRRTDPTSGAVFLRQDWLTKAASIGSREALQYITEAAEPVPLDYTAKTYEECRRVESQLARAFEARGIPVSFEHQGSVTNDTHIKLHSDIDLLTATEKYYGVRSPLTVSTPYQGNPVADLLEIRNTSVQALRGAFPSAEVSSKARCVSISGGSLARKVDVVSCNWLNTLEYEESGLAHLRGIEVLDAEQCQRVPNFPFLHNFRINERDNLTRGRLRRCIRLVKLVRSDAEDEIDLSSYDIASLCYNVPVDKLLGQTDLAVALSFLQFSAQILQNTAIRDGLMVPNGTRHIFGGPEGARPDELGKLVGELLDLIRSAASLAA